MDSTPRRALDVLGETVFLGNAVLAHDAGHGRGLGQALLLDQKFERAEAAAASRNLEHPGLDAFGIANRPDGDALQKCAPGDVLGQLVNRDAGLDSADIGLAQHQLVERDVPRRGQDDFLNSGHGHSP